MVPSFRGRALVKNRFLTLFRMNEQDAPAQEVPGPKESNYMPVGRRKCGSQQGVMDGELIHVPCYEQVIGIGDAGRWPLNCLLVWEAPPVYSAR